MEKGRYSWPRGVWDGMAGKGGRRQTQGGEADSQEARKCLPCHEIEGVAGVDRTEQGSNRIFPELYVAEVDGLYESSFRRVLSSSLDGLRISRASTSPWSTLSLAT